MSITPSKLEDCIIAYVRDVKKEPSAHKTLEYVFELRKNIDAVTYYHETHPTTTRDREKDYILATAHIKKQIDEDYKR